MHCCALSNVYRGPCCCGDFRTDYAIFHAPEKHVTEFHGLAKWCPLGPLVHRMAVNRSIVRCHSHHAGGLSGCGCCHHCIAWIFRHEKLAENHEILRSSNMAMMQCEIQTKTMGILMGKSSMNGGFSITTFGNQRVHSFTGVLLILMRYSLIASKA